MAWYDEALQRAKGLYQQGTNWATGNNFTSQNPDTVRAMKLDALGTNNQLQDDSFSDLSYVDDGTHHPRKAMPIQTRNLNYNIHQDPPVDWRGSYIHNKFGVPPNYAEMRKDVKRDGILSTNADENKENFIQRVLNNSMMGQLFGAFQTKPSMKEAINEINKTGMYKGTTYNINEDANKIYSEVNPYGLNLRSAWGSDDPEAMDQKTIDWARNRLQNKKKISKRLHGILAKKGIDKQGNWIDMADTGPQFKDTIPTGPIDKGGYQGPTTSSFNQAQAAKAGSYNRRAGPMSGSYGPWADGGRIGYQNGELVTDESMMEATPAGMVQENVEEVQGEPSREQLEALAMEIFQLPLEELNEEQLMIVYQAAMQQEPMQEDFQEEDVQYAAQGGLAGLL